MFLWRRLAGATLPCALQVIDCSAVAFLLQSLHSHLMPGLAAAVPVLASGNEDDRSPASDMLQGLHSTHLQVLGDRRRLSQGSDPCDPADPELSGRSLCAKSLLSRCKCMQILHVPESTMKLAFKLDAPRVTSAAQIFPFAGIFMCFTIVQTMMMGQA